MTVTVVPSNEVGSELPLGMPVPVARFDPNSVAMDAGATLEMVPLAADTFRLTDGDATVVRLVLVPATMELLGNANWWLPGWLGRVIPSVRIEGAAPRTGGAPGA